MELSSKDRNRKLFILYNINDSKRHLVYLYLPSHNHEPVSLSTQRFWNLLERKTLGKMLHHSNRLSIDISHTFVLGECNNGCNCHFVSLCRAYFEHIHIIAKEKTE